MKALLMSFILLACLGPPPSQLRHASFPSWGDADEPQVQAFFSPDGESAITSHYSLNLWDSSSGELLHHFKESLKLSDHDSYKEVLFLADGKRLLSRGTLATRAGGNGRPPRLWDLKSGQLLGSFNSPDSLPQAMAPTPDEKQLWVYALPREATDHKAVSFLEVQGGEFIPQLELWDLQLKKRKRVLRLPSRERLVALSGSHLVTLQGQPTNRFRSSLVQPKADLKVWDLRTTKPVGNVVLRDVQRLDHQTSVFSPSGAYLLMEREGGAITVDLNRGAVIRQLEAEGTLSWSVDDRGRVKRMTANTFDSGPATGTFDFKETADWARVHSSGHLLRRTWSKLQVHLQNGSLVADFDINDFLAMSSGGQYVATVGPENRIRIHSIPSSRTNLIERKTK